MPGSLRRLIAMITLLAGVLVIMPTTSSSGAASRAASTCYGTDCDGKLPQNQGCDNSYTYTVTSRRGVASGERAEVRYNPFCHAYWGRYVSVNPGGVYCPQTVIVQFQVGKRNADGSFRVIGSKSKQHDQCGYFWTRMLGAGQPRWARVRSTYLSCAAGACFKNWTAWSGWGKFS